MLKRLLTIHSMTMLFTTAGFAYYDVMPWWAAITLTVFHILTSIEE